MLKIILLTCIPAPKLMVMERDFGNVEPTSPQLCIIVTRHGKFAKKIF